MTPVQVWWCLLALNAFMFLFFTASLGFGLWTVFNIGGMVSAVACIILHKMRL